MTNCPFHFPKGVRLPCTSDCELFDGSYKMCSIKVIARLLKKLTMPKKGK